MSPLLLETRDLRRVYDVRRGQGVFSPPDQLVAVDGVSLVVRAGETLGLVGESGCGKSTTAKLVLGLIKPSAGQVLFEGEPLTSRRNEIWRRQRRRMQMVYQDPLGALDPRIDAGRQVREPLDILRQGTPSERQDRARELFEAVGLPRACFDKLPQELSGGQRQRVVLARALIMEPSLLVCDEPISALDVSIQAQVINLLMGLQDRLGLGYLFISHDLRVVRQIAHRVSEFPTTMEAASYARACGMKTVAGAPNIVRGGSHSGGVSAAELTMNGHLDGLSSDYVPSSLLQAVMRLHLDYSLALPKAMAMVTSNMADMLGLSDRGRLHVGLRADVLRIGMIGPTPITRMLWCAGERAY